MLTLMCAWTTGWTDCWDAGDLRRHRADCDVTVMSPPNFLKQKLSPFARKDECACVRVKVIVQHPLDDIIQFFWERYVLTFTWRCYVKFYERFMEVTCHPHECKQFRKIHRTLWESDLLLYSKATETVVNSFIRTKSSQNLLSGKVAFRSCFLGSHYQN